MLCAAIGHVVSYHADVPEVPGQGDWICVRCGKCSAGETLTLDVVFERDDKGQWIATIGAMHIVADSRMQALGKIQVLALRMVAEQLRHGDRPPLKSVRFKLHPLLAED
jgi:hypothetical protein